MRPLHLAAINNNSAAAELLLKAGAIVDCPQNEGMTALCIAAKRGAVDTMKVLLLNGANPNHPMTILGSRDSNSQKGYCKFPKKPVIILLPTMLALQSGPYTRSHDTISTSLWLLLKCGARISVPFELLPHFLPDNVLEASRTPPSLQTYCILMVRRLLVQANGGKSLFSVQHRFENLLPKSLVELLLFDFLSR